MSCFLKKSAVIFWLAKDKFEKLKQISSASEYSIAICLHPYVIFN